jgi:uncharacterized membrane protein HdeD (DUF308 family)
MPVEGSDAAERSLASQVLLVRGIVVGLLGVVAVFWPDVTVKVCAVLIGILVAIAGGSMLAHAFDRKRAELPWMATLVGGLVLLAGGLAAIFWPGPTVVAMARLFGLMMIISGTLTLIEALMARHDPAWMPMAVLGGLGLGVGVALFVWPDITIGVVVILQGVFWIIGGLLSVWASRQVAHGATL